ncbi:MAG: YfhO family protein [Anaerolineae bacterium]
MQGKRWWPLAFIFSLPVILFWQLIFADRVLYWGTPILQFHPWRYLGLEMIRAGHLPLWNHCLGNGAPLAANLQSAFFYPPHILYLFFPAERAMGYVVVLHVMMAGLFAYLYSRAIGLSRFGSLVAGTSYMFSGFLISRLGFLSMAASAPWLPFLFCLVELLVRRKALFWSLVLGLALGMQFLAGHAQFWYYSLWALAAYVLYRSWQVARTPAGCEAQAFPVQRPSKAWVGLFKIWSLFILAVLLSLAVSAVQLLPTMELAALSQRSGGAEYEFAMTYSFWPWRLITLVIPDFFGNPAHGDYWGYANYWEDCGYIGLLPFIFAFSLFSFQLSAFSFQHSPVPFFSMLCLVSILLAMGKNLPLYPLLFQYMPGFGFFQAPSRFLYLYTLGITVLAGIGADLLRPSRSLAKASRYVITVGLAVFLAAEITRLAFSAVKLTFVTATAYFALLLAVSGGLLVLRGFLVGGVRLWQALCLTFIVADLMAFGYKLNPTASAGLYHVATASGAFLREAIGGEENARVYASASYEYDAKFGRFFLFKDFGPRELERLLPIRESLLPNQTALEGIHSANNYDPLQVGRYSDLIEAVEDAPSPAGLRLLSLMNVGYILDDEPAHGLPQVFASEVKIYYNAAALPRACIVPEARVISDPNALLAELMSLDFDPRREVLLEGPPEAKASGYEMKGSSSLNQAWLASETIYHPAASEASQIRALRYEPNQVKIEAVLRERGYLFLSDTYYPGWRAYVDGREAEILRANYAFRALALPPGEHSIFFKYDPLSFKIGAFVSAAAWVGLGLAFSFLRWKR